MVRIKLATYPFQRYGMLEGELTSISADTKAADPPSAGGQDGGPAIPGYKGVVRLMSQSLEGGMGEMAISTGTISAGMQLTAEIIEGERTVMEYLLSPVRRIGSEAGRER
jgi:HlyD family secretion protein